VLVFSVVGYTSQEVKLGKQNNLSVRLKAQEQKLEEVVVTAQSAPDKRELQGKVAGITIQITETPVTLKVFAFVG
jgi:hypothetical protein